MRHPASEREWMSRPANPPIRHDIDSKAAFVRMARVIAAAMPARMILLAGEDAAGALRPLTHWCEHEPADLATALASPIDADVVMVDGHRAPVLRSQRIGPCGGILQVVVLGSIPERPFGVKDATLLNDIVEMAAPTLIGRAVAQTIEVIELKRREESSRLLFDSHPLPMLVIDV